MTAHEKAVEAAARQIMLKFQGRDLARETRDGMVQMSGRQIELLERLCGEAATNAISAYLASLKESGFVVVPAQPTKAMMEAANKRVAIVTPDGTWALGLDEAKRTYVTMLAAQGE